ncbi:MAG: hypothetical protein PHW62_00730 [Candidatus Ratteibacteria bacterium]|nr:hypothetical protein [Candidatus Ratteibacteria bacterium]
MKEMKGKGWHEDSEGHREAALKGALTDILRTPMEINNDPQFGKDWDIEIKGILIKPDLKTFIIAEQQKWDDIISPTIPPNFRNRYNKFMLLGKDSPEYIEFKKKNPKWYIHEPLEKISRLLRRHRSNIPNGSIPKLDIVKTKDNSLSVEEQMSPLRHRIIGVGIYISRGLYEPYFVDESFDWNERFNRFTNWYSISESGSSFIDNLLNRYPNRTYIEKFYESISSLIHTYQVFLLGREGLSEYYATAEDRRLVDALSHGAIMDEGGYINDPITGDRF